MFARQMWEPRAGLQLGHDLSIRDPLPLQQRSSSAADLLLAELRQVATGHSVACIPPTASVEEEQAVHPDAPALLASSMRVVTMPLPGLSRWQGNFRHTVEALFDWEQF